MRHSIQIAIAAISACVALSACSISGSLAIPAPAPGVPPAAPGGVPAALAAGPTPVAVPATTSATPPPKPTPSATKTPAPPKAPTATAPAAPPKDTRTGSGLDTPYEVDGIIVVSGEHPVSANYRPPQQVAPQNVTPETSAAITALIAGAKKDGLTAKVRSGYRSYQTQQSMLATKRKNYPSLEAELRYIALPGASEHQTGLAVDFWDGRNWGNAIGNTPLMKWLAIHAREYGFIQRYPQGKESVTGCAHEAWHYRYVGTAVSLKFQPSTSLTLEEFLGLA